MSFAPPAGPRQPLHLRRISCEAFQHEDGTLEIEGLLIDTKPLPVRLPTGREVAAEQPIHQMRVRLRLDREGIILDARVFSEHSPYPECAGVEAAYRKLIGLRIEAGFAREVKRLFGGTAGCTHMSELIPPMASTLFQVLWAESKFDPLDMSKAGGRASPLGGCHGLRLDGEVVRRHFPTEEKRDE